MSQPGFIRFTRSWQLRVKELAAVDVGYIDRFKITFP